MCPLFVRSVTNNGHIAYTNHAYEWFLLTFIHQHKSTESNSTYKCMIIPLYSLLGRIFLHP